MTLVLEDGTAPAGANSYATEDMADSYFDDRANTTWTDSTSDKEAALIRATQALDAVYRTRFPGTRTNGREQSLEWPRQQASDVHGNALDQDSIPDEIVDATCELAVRELVTPGSAMPDLKRAVRSIRAGSVSIEFSANARESTLFQIVDGILGGLIGGGSARSLTGQTFRG